MVKPGLKDAVFHENLPDESTEALSLLRSIADCNHLVLFSIQLPIFINPTAATVNWSTFQRLPGAQHLHSFLQNSTAASTPITPQSLGPMTEVGIGGELQRARSKISLGSNAGQINRGFTSVEVG